MASSPWDLFQSWRQEADFGSYFNPDSVALATVATDLKPSVRMVYFKGIQEGGFSFFTNYQSKKALQIVSNKQAALLFYWPHLQKQIRIEGEVEKLNRKASIGYFSKRSRESQITAAVSKQSRLLIDEFSFLQELEEFTQAIKGQEINCPIDWGGYKLVPQLFEFWESGKARRHKRLQFQLMDREWKAQRLYP